MTAQSIPKSHLTKSMLLLMRRLPKDPLNSLIVGAASHDWHKLEKAGLVTWRGEVFGGNAYSITDNGLAALKLAGVE